MIGCLISASQSKRRDSGVRKFKTCDGAFNDMQEHICWKKLKLSYVIVQSCVVVNIPFLNSVHSLVPPTGMEALLICGSFKWMSALCSVVQSKFF